MSSVPDGNMPGAGGERDVEAASADVATSAPSRSKGGLSRKQWMYQWMYLAIATLLLVGLALGLGLGLGLSGKDGGKSRTSSAQASASDGSPTVVPTTQPSMSAPIPAPSNVADNPTDSDSTSSPDAMSPTPNQAASPPNPTSVPASTPSPNNATAPTLSPVALPSNTNAFSAFYTIIWQEYVDEGCDNREHVVTISCPFLMLFYNGTDCQAIDETQNAITCTGYSRDTIDVGCVGTTIEELLLDVDVSGSVHTCNEGRIVTDSFGTQFTKYVEGNVRLVTTVIMTDCSERPALSCSGTYAVELNTETLTGCGSEMVCSGSETCLTGFPGPCFGLFCQ